MTAVHPYVDDHDEDIDDVDFKILTEEEWNEAWHYHLRKMNLTYDQILQMVEEGYYEPYQARALWVCLGDKSTGRRPTDPATCPRCAEAA